MSFQSEYKMVETLTPLAPSLRTQYKRRWSWFNFQGLIEGSNIQLPKIQ